MRRAFESLYVHVPFCERKCDYCAFYSLAGVSPHQRAAYLARLRDEMASRSGDCTALASIYIGGGTPSCLPEPELARLLSLMADAAPRAPGAEWTVECNPASLTEARARALAEHGVNRVSLGIQSFEAHLRRALGRHTPLGDPARIIGSLRRAGIANVGLDLIFGIPGQTLADWRADLERACALAPTHLSCYELTVEPGTPLARRRPPALDEDLAVAMWEAADEVGARYGLARYEVSNLARPGFECRHNMDVWHGGTYLGCGPAASSFDGDLRWTNPADLDAWLAGEPPEEDPLPPDRRAAELLGLGLRTVRGWGRQEFRERTGFDFVELRGPQIERLADEGLVELTDEDLRPTRRGLLLGNRVAGLLL